ncbi:MAG: hypothetical protein ABS46_12340, partial [Cytophagaceae bacterium SCN 52-12]
GVNAVRQLFLTPGFWLFVAFYPALFYFNTRWLIPSFFQKKKYIAYALISLCCLGLVYKVSPFENLVFRQTRELHEPKRIRNPAPPPGRPFSPGQENRPLPREPADRPQGPGPQRIDIISIVLWGMVWSVGMFAAASDQWQKAQQEVLKSQADKARAELAFLRAQINPHFLFNTLSNLYALATLKSDETAPGILKLSNLMRYLVEESAADAVLLTREIDFIRNYIELQKIRLSGKTTVDFSAPAVGPEVAIAPMILITFVENAFKYGVSASKETLIRIHLSVKDGLLGLCCSNQVINKDRMPESTGIGIGNTRRRLQHHYPGKHELDIRESGDFFEIRLRIDLSVSEIPGSTNHSQAG